MKGTITILYRAAIWLLLCIPFQSIGQSVTSLDTLPKIYRCGADNSAKFKVSADLDWIYYLQDERSNNTQLYRVSTVSGRIDSFSFKSPYSTDLTLYEMTAMDVSEDTLVICYGDNIYIYDLSREKKCLYLKHITISTGEVIFSANLHQGKLYLSCDMPDKGKKHTFRTIDVESGLQTYEVEHFTHLATLTTFNPSCYFAHQEDTTFYFDSENFQVLTIKLNTIDTLIDIKGYFEADNTKFLKSTARIKGLNELDHYIMNGLGKFQFDFIHEIFISNSKIFLFYFPTNHSSTFNLERFLCVIDRSTGNQTTYYIKRTENHGLVDFQSVLVGDKLFIVSNNDRSIYVQEYSTLSTSKK